MSSPQLINRRQAITRLALLMGGAVIGAESFLSGASVGGKPAMAGFSAGDIALMDEIGETIIPTTNTPGAKATQIGAFMAMMVTDCYDADHHAIFKTGLVKVDELARSRHSQTFVACTPAQRTALLNGLDVEQRTQAGKKKGEAPHYFRMMKQLSILGYFTSEIGSTQALRYKETPGSFDGNVAYKKGDRAWAVPAGRNL